MPVSVRAKPPSSAVTRSSASPQAERFTSARARPASRSAAARAPSSSVPLVSSATSRAPRERA